MKPISRWQFGLLVYIDNNNVTPNDCRMINNRQVQSIINHGWARMEGKYLRLTFAGHELKDAYRLAKPLYREHEADLTSAVAGLIAIGHNRRGIHRVHKAA